MGKTAAMSPPADARGLLPRFAQELVEQTLADTPITVIQGARQVGKSTLARQVLAGRDARLLSLDTTAVYEAAKADPDSFVRQAPGLLPAVSSHAAGLRRTGC